VTVAPDCAIFHGTIPAILRFPGLPATYANLIDEYRNKRYVAEPQSIADFS